MHVSLHNTQRETLEGSGDEREESNKSIVETGREKKAGANMDRVSSATKQTFNH